jgi:hypothetical protein
MMSETEAYIQLTFVVGILLCLPYASWAFFVLGKVLIAKFFPPKFISLEITDLDKNKRIVNVSLNDPDDLMKALLKCQGGS